MQTKICTKCGSEYPATAEYFYKCNSSKDGWRSICKICDKKKWAKDSQKKQEIKQKEQQKVKNDLKSRGVKICPKCNRELPANLDYFYSNISMEDGLSFWCKECSRQVRAVWTAENYDTIIKKKRAKYKENMQNPEFVERQRRYDKQYYAEHKKYKRMYSKQYKEEHREKQLQQGREYYRKNRERLLKASKKWNAEHKEYVKERQRKYNAEHKEEQSIKNKLRHQNNKIARNFSTSICHALKGSKAERHWETLVPYNLAQLRQHLEKQFIPPMSWNNYGTYWEVDHIIPQNIFNFTSSEDHEFQICWSLLNLRPLSKIENRSRPKDGSDISDELKALILNQ